MIRSIRLIRGHHLLIIRSIRGLSRDPQKTPHLRP